MDNECSLERWTAAPALFAWDAATVEGADPQSQHAHNESPFTSLYHTTTEPGLSAMQFFSNFFNEENIFFFSINIQISENQRSPFFFADVYKLGRFGCII